MAKDFIYLVQARSDMVPRNLSLESSRADLIIYTWDKKIMLPNALFKPKTVWAEGRNILIDAAKKLKHKYKYYILLDDDVEFINGNAQKFEDEILAADPDACIPIVPANDKILGNYSMAMPFRYLAMNLIDEACICLSKEFFFSDKLLPYHTLYNDSPAHQRSYYSARYFWMMLFENYSDRKLLVTKNIKHINQNSIFEYNIHPQYYSLLDKVMQKEHSFKNSMHKHLPFTKYIDNQEALKYRRKHSRQVQNLAMQALYRNPRRYLLNYIIPNTIMRIKKKIICSKTYYRLFTIFFILPVFIYRDIKINIKILFDKIK